MKVRSRFPAPQGREDAASDPPMPMFDFASLFAFCDLHASRIWRTNPRVRKARRFYDRQGFPIPQPPEVDG